MVQVDDIMKRRDIDKGKGGFCYFDNAASTMVEPKAISAMLPYFGGCYANPSAIHSQGRLAAKALVGARQVIAKKLGASPDEIIFTSGATESDNLAIRGVVSACGMKRCHVITSAIEHPAVLEQLRALEKDGVSVTYLKVDKDGFVDPADVKKNIRKDTVLVSVMHANNEIGTVEPVDKIGKVCRDAGVLFHTDAAQSFAKVPIDVKRCCVDLISMSAHKIHGPKGVGALYVRKGTELRPFLRGSGQEFGLRPGTENVSGIVGFAAAVGCMSLKDISRMVSLRDLLIKGLLSIPHTRLNGAKKLRLCNNVNILFEGVPSSELLMHLDSVGIEVTTGSACSSLDLKASHVLTAIGVSESDAHACIRFSISKFTTKKEVEYVVRKTGEAVVALRLAHGV
jgi:cysteine desulfurase